MDLSGIKTKLSILKHQDDEYKVFGSYKHKYASTLAKESDLQKFEARWHIRLPSDYRKFLLRIGYGAGPYYGVWSPRESHEELELLSEDIPEVPFFPSYHFPLGPKEIDDIRIKKKVELDWPVTGCIPICHQGCACWNIIVVTGRLAGTVWDVSEGVWAPARRPPAILSSTSIVSLPPMPELPTFLDWFESWLDHGIASLEGQPRSYSPLRWWKRLFR